MDKKLQDFIQANGELFEAVQVSGIYEDSKYFVDTVPAEDPSAIMAKWNNEKNDDQFDLKAFADKYFRLPEDQSGETMIEDARNMRDHISKLWAHLFRSSDSDSLKSSTLIPLPHPYVVPGGRFREIYYWDSYFTSLGLAADGHSDMVLSMVKNFSYLIETVGHIPNGNRVYYLSRSQPPFFAPMVRLVESLFGKEEVKPFLSSIEKEYAFWMDETGERGRRSVEITSGLTLNRYWDDYPHPRQESWIEDVEAAEKSGRDKKQVYRDIRAGAESGWDFTSRWFADGKSLETIETTSVIPVDLNSLIWFLENQLSKWFSDFGDQKKEHLYAEKAKNRKEAMLQLMWNDKEGFFFDYHFDKKRQTSVWSLAAVYPLYFGLADQSQAEKVADNLINRFLKPGGLLTTLNNTGEQWDSPNGWAPLQWLAYAGLKRYGFEKESEAIRKNWIRVNEEVYNRTGKMVEKYNVIDISQEGGGGEYPLQDGFGWSNGVSAAMIDGFEI